MAYDRYDTRDQQSRWQDRQDYRGDRSRSPERGSDDRGFFERAGDEIASWFGDDRDRDRMSDRDRQSRGYPERGSSHDLSRSRDDDRGYGRDAIRDRESYASRHRDDHRNPDDSRPTAWPSSESDYNPAWRSDLHRDRDERQRSGGYRPMTGDYGRSERMSGAGGYGARDWDSSRDRNDRDNRSEWGSDEYRSTSRAGSRDKSDRSRDNDPHYRSWREQHMSALDRDYDDYRREHQSKFDSDFSTWRERRSQKRGMLGNIREHMDVIGNDDEHVGTVDKVAGDRIILTKSDPESGGAHHSLSCSDIDRVEGDKVILDCSADKALERWRDESRSRALFEREDQGEMGSHTLNRAFEGTYR